MSRNPKRFKNNKKSSSGFKRKFSDCLDPVKGKTKIKKKVSSNKDCREKTKQEESKIDESKLDASSLNTDKPSEKHNSKKQRFILFVGNLSYTTTKESLENHFKKAGKLVDVRIPLDHERKPKGMAFVEFKESSGLLNALLYHHTTFEGRKINVEMTCGGGGNSKKRKEKIEKKRVKSNQLIHNMLKHKKADMKQMSEDLRLNPNWNAILQWSMRYQDDGAFQRNLTPMDQERQDFLRNALENAVASDPVSEIKKSVTILKSPEATDNDLIEALEELTFHCEDIDLSNDVYLMGGLHLCRAYVKHSNPELQWRACEVIGNATQNNEKVLNFVLECDGILQDLLELVDTAGTEISVSIKSVYAISCLIRGHRKAQAKFNDLEGYNVLIRALQRSSNEKLRMKILFLIRDICMTTEEQSSLYVSMGVHLQLVESISARPLTRVHDHAILLLEVLTRHDLILPAHARSVVADYYTSIAKDVDIEEANACTVILKRMDDRAVER